METIEKRKKSPEALRIIEKRKEITKHGNLQFNFDSGLNRRLCVPRRPDRQGRDEGAAIDIGLLFRNNEKSRWGGGYFEFSELKPGSSEKN